MELNKTLVYGIFVTILAYFFSAMASCFVRVLDGFPTSEVIFFQNVVSFILVFPYCLHKGLHKLKTSSFKLHLARDIFGVVSYFLYFLAIRMIDIVDASVLAYTTPFFTPLIVSLWEREKFSKHIWWTIILGFIGIALIIHPTKAIFSQIGSFVAILSAIISALALVALRLLNKSGESFTRTLFYYFFIGSVISLPFALYSFQRPTLEQMLLLIGVGATTAFCQLFLTEAYRYGTASFLSPLTYSTIVFTIIFGYFIFDIEINAITLLGTFLIIFGGCLTFFLHKGVSMQTPNISDKIKSKFK